MNIFAWIIISSYFMTNHDFFLPMMGMYDAMPSSRTFPFSALNPTVSNASRHLSQSVLTNTCGSPRLAGSLQPQTTNPPGLRIRYTSL